MRPVRVTQHLRRRRQMPAPRIVIKSSAKIPHIRKALGRTKIPSGQSTIHLKSNIDRLKRDTKLLAIRLKEAHVRDEIIDTLIHEALHSAIAIYGRPGVSGIPGAQKNPEERLVTIITEDIMKDIRTIPEVPLLGTSEFEAQHTTSNPRLSSFGIDTGSLWPRKHYVRLDKKTAELIGDYPYRRGRIHG